MNNFLYYLFEVSCVFAVLYLVYWLLFSRLTFHWINRILLLLMFPLSLIIPVLNFGLNPSAVNNIAIPRFNEIVTLNQPEIGLNSNFFPAFDISIILMIFYYIGLMTFVFRLVLSALKLIHIKQMSSFKYNNGFLIISADIPLVFSCFNWIFMPENDHDKYEGPIIWHEKLHASLFHTLDLIITELFVALFWFNPFVYFFRKSIKSVHEFQVDEIVLKGDVRKSHYLKLILDTLEYKYNKIGLYNYFNGITIKKRVKMITKNKSSKVNILKYLVILPITALLIMSFTHIIGEKPELFPVLKGDSTRITSGYGNRTNPITKEHNLHAAIDIKANEDVPVLATAGGKVIKVTTETGWGNLIIIDHGDGFQSRYAHLKGFNVKSEELVKKGQTIGYVGKTGISVGPHLHFEIWLNGKPVDPSNYVKE